MAIAEPYPTHMPAATPVPAAPTRVPTDDDFAAHVRTYRAFVRYTVIFTAHVVVILALMAYFLV